MNRSRRVHVLSLSLLFSASLFRPFSLHAASQMTQVMSTFGGNGFFNWEYKEAFAYDKGRGRTDMEFTRLFHSTPEQQAHIERLDIDTRWTLDTKRKRYTEESISEAQARLAKEMEKSREAWEKKDKKAAKPDEEDGVRIKSAKTTTQGPGALVDINGFSCRPYTVKTVIEMETVKDAKPAGTQTIYAKVWTTDAPALAAFYHDQEAFWLSVGKDELKDPQLKQFMQTMKGEVEKARKDSASNPWLAYMDAVGKIKGRPVRNFTAFTFLTPTGQPTSSAAPADTSKDDDLLQAGDVSGGVSSMVSGMATRWASKKVEKKVQAKMAEHPAWVDEASKDLQGAQIGWGYMTEVKTVQTTVPKDTFEVPAGYKKVKSL